MDIPEDTVENGNPKRIESPGTGFGVDVLTIRDVINEASVSQNRARNLVLKAYNAYELTAGN